MRAVSERLLISVAIVLVLGGCAGGGKSNAPAPSAEPPKKAKAETYIPKDLEDCFVQLEKLGVPADLDRMRRGTEGDLVWYHYGLGSGIRSTWLGGKSPLTKWFMERGIFADDDISGIILTSFYRHLQGQDIRLAEQIEDYQLFYRVRDQVVAPEVYELIDAIAAHDLEKVQSFVEKGADVNGAEHYADHVLAKAVRAGDRDIVRYLVEHGADVDPRDVVVFQGRPIVLDAVHAGNLDILRYLVEQGADVKAAHYDGHNAVAEAVICRKLDILKYLVQEQGMDINLPCERGYPPIVHLYEQLEEPGACDVLEYMIDKGADVYAPDWGGLTLPERAKRFHHDKVVELLQTKGVLKEG